MVIIHKKHKETAQEKELRVKREQEEALGIQDQYQAKGFELVTFAQKNKGIVLLLISVLVVSGALFSGYLFYQKRKAQEASAAFLKAISEIKDEMTAEEKKKAQTDLLAVAENFKTTDVATLAQLYSGHVSLENNDAKLSVVEYSKAVDRLKKSDPLYKLALIGLGYALEKNGDKKGALLQFETLVNQSGAVGVDLALWEAARLAKENQENEKAKKYLARLFEEYPSSIYEPSAKRLEQSL